MTRMYLVVVVTCFAIVLAAMGCKEEEKDYSCDEAMDKMYDEDCEMWCSNDGYTIWMDTCAWYDDDDPYNFPESLAKDICDEIEDQADDEDCMGEFQDVLNCLVKEAKDDCAGDCDGEWDDLTDCLDW